MIDKRKSLIFGIIGLIFSTLPPLFATLSFFPIWKERGPEAMLSGLSLCLILISAVPIIRAVKRAVSAPSAPLLWFFLFVLFFLLSRIADDITVIAFVGFISNLIGALFFSISRKYGDKRDEK